MARRTATSRCRARARASSRPETFAHATSNTRATTPVSTRSGREYSSRKSESPWLPSTTSTRDTIRLVLPTTSSPAAALLSSISVTAASRSCACDALAQATHDAQPADARIVEVPSVRRTADASPAGPRRRARGSTSSPKKPGRATPTMVNGCFSSVMRAPRMLMSPPKRRTQNAWLNTATASPPGVTIVVRRERPPDQRGRAEHREVLAGHEVEDGVLGPGLRLGATHLHLVDAVFDRQHAGEGARLLPQHARTADTTCCSAVPDRPAGQMMTRRSGAVTGSDLEQHRVDQREDGGVGADAERQRQRP